MKVVFEPAGEPVEGEDEHRPEAYETDYHWKQENHDRWQLHSEVGPSIDAEAQQLPPPKPFEHLVNPEKPPLGREYERHWTRGNFDSNRASETWEKLRNESNAYSDETLSRDT